MITCSPSRFHLTETLASLRFGDRAQAITTLPKQNVEHSVSELKRLVHDANRQITRQAQAIHRLEATLREYEAHFGRLPAAPAAAARSGLTFGHANAPKADSPAAWLRAADCGEQSGCTAGDGERCKAGLGYSFHAVVGAAVGRLLRCPLSGMSMREPVVAVHDGRSYDKSALLGPPSDAGGLGQAPTFIPNRVLAALLAVYHEAVPAQAHALPPNAWHRIFRLLPTTSVGILATTCRQVLFCPIARTAIRTPAHPYFNSSYPVVCAQLRTLVEDDSSYKERAGTLCFFPGRMRTQRGRCPMVRDVCRKGTRVDALQARGVATRELERFHGTTPAGTRWREAEQVEPSVARKAEAAAAGT